MVGTEAAALEAARAVVMAVAGVAAAVPAEVVTAVAGQEAAELAAAGGSLSRNCIQSILNCIHTAIRARRRMPRRNQRPDRHIQREHRMVPRLWAIVCLYDAWLTGALDAGSAPLLNALLERVLGPAGSGSLSFVDDEFHDDRVAIDVRDRHDAQAAALCGLGWSAYPSTSALVGHVLDRLEYDWALRLLELDLEYSS